MHHGSIVGHEFWELYPEMADSGFRPLFDQVVIPRSSGPPGR
jgi:hypothetical protein